VLEKELETTIFHVDLDTLHVLPVTGGTLNQVANRQMFIIVIIIIIIIIIINYYYYFYTIGSKDPKG